MLHATKRPTAQRQPAPQVRRYSNLFSSSRRVVLVLGALVGVSVSAVWVMPLGQTPGQHTPEPSEQEPFPKARYRDSVPANHTLQAFSRVDSAESPAPSDERGEAFALSPPEPDIANAYHWESERDYNLDSEIDPREISLTEDAPHGRADPPTTPSPPPRLDTSDDAFASASAAIDAAIATSRWTMDSYVTVAVNMEMLDENQRRAIRERFHAALNSGLLDTSKIEVQTVPVLF